LGIARITCLLLILFVAAAFIFNSFQPRVRFGQPGTQFSGVRKSSIYSCYHDKIYLGNSDSEILFFGSSATGHAIDGNEVMTTYESVTGKSLDAFVFHTPWSNPELQYFFFRDYLANNPAPEVGFFELTKVKALPNQVRYIHPLFSDLAPPYLYLDVLHSWGFVQNRLFATSDFLRLFIRHVDLILSRLLVADSKYAVTRKDNCSGKDFARDPVVDTPRFDSFQEILEAKLEAVQLDISEQRIGHADALLNSYEGNPFMRKAVERAIVKFGDSDAWPNTGHFWRQGPLSERSMDYYRRIAALARAHDVKIAFYFLPELLFPEPPAEQVEELAGTLGAPVYLLPFKHVKLSYHHHRDPAHISAKFTPAYSAWFASLIDRVGTR
jgi:hypothetical protein